MRTVTAEEASKGLQAILQEASASHEPIQILGDVSSGVLVSEEDWRALQETLYLLSIPGMRDSIRDGMKTPVDECSEELTW
jgi:antitoxin YefM